MHQSAVIPSLCIRSLFCPRDIPLFGSAAKWGALGHLRPSSITAIPRWVGALLCTFLAKDLLEFGQQELQEWPVAGPEEEAGGVVPPRPGEAAEAGSAVLMMAGYKRWNRVYYADPGRTRGVVMLLVSKARKQRADLHWTTVDRQGGRGSQARGASGRQNGPPAETGAAGAHWRPLCGVLEGAAGPRPGTSHSRTTVAHG